MGVEIETERGYGRSGEASNRHRKTTVDATLVLLPPRRTEVCSPAPSLVSLSETV